MPFRLMASAAAIAAIAVGVATPRPAHAWKPKTHIYFAEQALKDAVDDGRVTIYQTDYRTGRVIGTLGTFPVDPRILAALRASPKQYRAGVLGPDAYPDITTGQCLIHPHQAHALDGQTADGTNSWLTHLWNLTYGPMNLYTGTGTRAFAIGYLTHAAGDLFAHTFMNNFSGGEFMLQPDPRNALKHLILEGYIGKRTPLTIDTFGNASSLSAAAASAAYPGSSFPGLAMAELRKRGTPVSPASITAVTRDLEGAIVTENDVSIDGLENFIAGEMTFGRPGSVLYDRLLNVDERKKSLPYVFSTLRNKLQAEVDRYNKLGRLDKIAYTTTHPGRITFIEHWIKDIDKGLVQWPKTSHELGRALVYNETGGGADLARAKAALNDYVKNYLVYMGPVPDVAVNVLKFMGAIMDALVPDFIKEAIDEMVKDFQNWVAKKVTGRTFDEWADVLANPQTHFDPILNGPGGDRPGRNAQQVSLAGMNRDFLHISDPGYSDGTTETFKIESFPPAFNTVQMCKLLLLGKEGMNGLLDTLAAKGAKRPTLPANFENVMLGWHQSLDNDNQWQGLASRDANPAAKLIFAQDGGDTYQRLFMKQVGEVDWVTAPAPAPEATPTDPSTPVPGNPNTSPTTPPPGRETGPTTPPVTPTTPPTTGGGGTTPPTTGETAENGGSTPGRPASPRIGDGKFYSMDIYDVRVEKLERWRGETLQMWVTLRNRSQSRAGVTASSLTFQITDTDGVGIRNIGNLYWASGEDPRRLESTAWLEPGEEVRVRFLFTLPQDIQPLKKMTLQEYSARLRTFDLTGLTLAPP